MEILTVTTFYPNSADRYRAVFVRNLVSALRKLCRVSVVSPVPFVPPLRRVPGWYALSRIAPKETIDGMEILHPRFMVIPKLDWLSGVGYFLGVLRLLRRARKKGGGLLVHAHCAYPDGVGVALAARMLGLPYVITAHGSDVNLYSTRLGLRFQIRWAMRGARGVIAVSHDLQEKIRRLLNAEAPRIEHIPCAGYDPDLFFPQESRMVRKRLNVGNGRLIVFIGTLAPIKGVDILIDAWSRLCRAGDVTEADQLVLIGEGKCREALERQAADAGIEHCTRFLGGIPQAQVSLWIAAADLLCLASHHEGTPNVIVEALACGVPVVASRVGGVPEIIFDEVNGKLVNPGDAGEFSQALRSALSRPWDRETVRRSVSHLTWESIAEKNLRFLQSVSHEATA
ncbi:MAG: glycosyltransferase family 4 protein [Sulfuricaulis sp.]